MIHARYRIVVLRTLVVVLLLSLFPCSCVIAPVRVVRYIDGTSATEWGFNYDFGPLLGRGGIVGCDLRTDNFDHSSAKLLTERSYVIDPSGKKRNIKIINEYRDSGQRRTRWYRVSIELDDVGPSFGGGKYTMHLELKETEKVYTFHGQWQIVTGLGTPL